MDTTLNRFELWWLRKVLKKVIRQGNQDQKVIAFNKEFIAAARAEYYEDNDVTLHSFLIDCFEAAWQSKGHFDEPE